MTKIMSYLVLAFVLIGNIAGAQEVPVRGFPEATPTASPTPTATPRATPARVVVPPVATKKETAPWGWTQYLLLGALGLLSLGALWFVIGRLFQRKPAEPWQPIGHDRGGHGTAIVLISLTLTGQAWAQSPAPSPTPTPTFEIRRVISDGVVSREVPNSTKKIVPAKIVISVHGQGEVKGIEAAARGLTFTDIKLEGDLLYANVVASVDAETGRSSFRLVMMDGTKALAPEGTFILVLSAEGAAVREDAAKASASTARAVQALRKETLDTFDGFSRGLRQAEQRIDIVEASQLTAEQVRIIAGEKIAPVAKDVARHDREIGVVANMDRKGLELLHEFAAQEVGFLWWKHPRNREVAEQAKALIAVYDGKEVDTK